MTPVYLDFNCESKEMGQIYYEGNELYLQLNEGMPTTEILTMLGNASIQLVEYTVDLTGKVFATKIRILNWSFTYKMREIA